MDKMDDFIKKRLGDETPSEDAWNIPSDDLWNNAKVHFPKEKKKRRWFWIPILLGLFLSTSIGFYFGKNSLSHKNTLVNSVNSDQQVTPIIEETKHITPTSNTTENKSTQQSDIKIKGNSPTLQKKSSIQTPKVATSIPIIDNEITTKNIVPTDTQHHTTLASTFTKSLKMVKSKADFNVNAYEQGENITSDSIKKPAQRKWDVETISTLLLPIHLDKRIPVLVTPRKSVPKGRMFHSPNQELGIGYSETLLRLLTVIEIRDPDSGNSFSLDMDYKNINLHYTKWIKRKWSLSTGLYFSEFDLDANISDFSAITNEDIDTYVSQQIDDAIQFRQIANPSSNTGDEFKIKLIDGEQLIEGDSVNVKTEIKLYSRIFQIPVLINYHVYKNRFEWIFSAGASLDFDHFDLKPSNIEIYKAGRLINETRQIPADLENNITGSIHGMVTMRYHINRSLNLGLSSKIYFNNPLLSNIEAGLYYRF